MDTNLNYLDVYNYDIELYQFITKKYGENEKSWKLFFASYIDPDGYSGEGIRYVKDVKCTSDALLSIRRIHAKEGFGKEFIEVFSDYRKASIFYFPCEDGGINQTRAKYLEDRIDHTLLDLKNYCAGKKNCFLKEAYRKPKTKAWLDSFNNEFEGIADSMNLVGTFVNDEYEVIDIERSDGSTLNNLKETYINPRCKAYLSAWSSDYYMRFTKGNHAFIVCTHTDRPHIHNHILFSAVELKQQKKFRNFLYSGIALQRLSDIICLENGLSVIQPRKPSERERHVFPKYENKRDAIKFAIDIAVSKQPKDFDEFLWLLQRQDYEIKRGKHTAVKGKGGERFIRFRSLGNGYRESDIREKIAAMQKNNKSIVQPKTNESFDMLLSIQDIIAKGKGPGYERWAKKYNIKNLAKALIFFQENDVRSYEELAKRAADSSQAFSELSDRIKATEKRLDEISALREQIIKYAKTKDIYVEYRKSGYSRKFFEAHKEDIMKHKAAKDTFEKMKGTKIPSVKELNEEFQQLLAQKRKDYSQYHDAKEKMQLYKVAKYDIDRILNQDIEKEKARLQSRERSQTR